MTEYSLLSAKITSSPNQFGWTQIHEFHPEKPELLEARGHFYAAISCSEPIDATRHKTLGIDNIFVGREVLTRLHEEYYGESSLGAFNAIGESVTKVAKEFSSIYKNIEIAAMSYVGGVVYSSAIGGGEIILFRQNMLARLLMSKSGIEEMGKAVTASGYPQEGDILIAATSSFFQKYSEGVIRAALQIGELSQAVERLSGQYDGNLSAVLVKFGDKEKSITSQVNKINIEQGVGEEGGKITDADVTKRKNIFNIIASIIPEKPVRLRRRKEDDEIVQGRRKTTASVGVILLLILLVSIIFGISQKTRVDKQKDVEEKITSAELKLDEALSLYPLNQERARELFLESRQMVDELEDLDNEKLGELREKLKVNLESVLGEHESSAESFLDLTLLSDGFNGNLLGFDEENLYILDSGSSRVISVDLNSKRSEVVAGPNFAEGATDIAAYSDRVFLLIPPEIFEVEEDSRDEIDDAAAINSSIRVYAGNIYLLDKTESKIYRYPGNEGVFSDRQEWLAPGVEVNLADVSSWAIDGTMWLLSGKGVLRFSLGNPTNFEMSGIFPPLDSPTKIFTNENTDYIYLLEPVQKRIIVIDKEGNYKAQYKADEIGNAKDFVIFESGKKAIILTGDKLLSLEIKHIN
jgi:hypothetical protein